MLFFPLTNYAYLGGADRHVIVWSSTGDILRQFTHSGSVQALAFNPRTLVLASGTTEELSLWHDDGSSGLHEGEASQLGNRSSFLGSKSWGMSHSNRSTSRHLGSASSSLSNAIAVSLGWAGGNSDLKPSQSSRGLQRCDRIKASSRICSLSWNDEGKRLAAGQEWVA